MYSLNNVEFTIHAIKNYVKACMKEKKLGNEEIREYDKLVGNCAFEEAVELSQEYIDMLNKMEQEAECKITYL